ncbi:MAG: carboxymuconolactone decarboxylase family protein [Pseudomonadota bacterium]
MADFTIHTAENHPDAAADIIAKVKGKYGFVPNLIGALAEAPEAAEAYLALGDALQRSAFTPTERHVVWFTINTFHACHYCMAAHTAIAKKDGVADDVIETARTSGDYADPKLQALKVFTLEVVRERGWVKPERVDAFLNAGFSRRHVFDVLLAVSHKVLSNYTNHLVETPVDTPFQPFTWTPAAQAAE